jgi:hypothetical protein
MVNESDIDHLVDLIKDRGLRLGVRTLKTVAETYFIDRLWF